MVDEVMTADIANRSPPDLASSLEGFFWHPQYDLACIAFFAVFFLAMSIPKPRAENKYIQGLKQRRDSFSTLSVSLSGFSIIKDYHEFVLECRTSTLKWEIRRRYNNFVYLHKRYCTALMKPGFVSFFLGCLD